MFTGFSLLFYFLFLFSFNFVSAFAFFFECVFIRFFLLSFYFHLFLWKNTTFLLEKMIQFFFVFHEKNFFFIDFSDLHEESGHFFV